MIRDKLKFPSGASNKRNVRKNNKEILDIFTVGMSALEIAQKLTKQTIDGDPRTQVWREEDVQ